MDIKFRLRLSLVPARLLALCALASAPTLLASPVQMVMTGVNGASAFGEYVGPYFGTMNGKAVDLFCVDFVNQVSFGQRWDANLSQLGIGADLANTRFGGTADALRLYQEAAWLTLQFASQPSSRYGEIHASIWQIFSPSAPQTSSSWWLDQARLHYAEGDYRSFRVVTNLGPVLPRGQIQEFLVRVPPSEVPEPGTQVLIGVAVLVGVTYLRRRGSSAR